MEKPGQVHNSDHIINLSASSPENHLDHPTAMPLSTSTDSVPQLTVIHTNDSSSNSSRLQLCLEMVFIAVQIVASAVVLVISNDERLQTPFRDLIISYVILCFIAWFLLYWDYHNLDQTFEQNSDIALHICFQRIILFETFASLIMEDDAQRTIYRTRSILYSENPSPMQLLVNSSRTLLNIFIGYWLVISGIFLNTPSQSPEAHLYWLTSLFFAHGCFEHIVALLVFPVLNISGVLAKQGAQSAAIDALPTHHFKLKVGSASDAEKGGVWAAGTDMERVISGEDAVCSICLGIYADNDELRELPCSHLLHKDCVDMWLKIKATCHLCNRVIH